MPGKKKKFIEKKDSVTFHLVHRSQRDPLQADDEAPLHVLLPAKPLEARLVELKKYGVFYDDDYDYMQHLRDANDLHQVAFDTRPVPGASSNKEAKLQLPSKVFGSSVETSVGMLNKAVEVKGPQPDWDPDIVAGLDEDFDYENPANQLEDDFMEFANAEGGGDAAIASDEADWSDDDGVGSDFGSLGERSFANEETRSRFTAYSMTSSVMRRNDGLTLLDDRFEQLYGQYDDDEIGALDAEEIEGAVRQQSVVLRGVMDEFERENAVTLMKDVVQKAEGMQVASQSEDESDDDDLETFMKVAEPQKAQWDCASIISTYSNLYNHPKRIDEPDKPRVARPHRVTLPPEEAPCEAEQRQRASTQRPKDETLDEKRARKRAVKDERKLRRVDKKANKQAFKVEESRQSKELMNIRNNLQGMKVI